MVQPAIAAYTIYKKHSTAGEFRDILAPPALPAAADSVGTVVKTVVLLLTTEIILTLLCSAVIGWQWGREYGVSALVGGGICLVTTAYFALRVFSGSRAKADEVVRAFYVGEGQKIFLTVALFIMAIKLLPVHFAPLISTYVVAHLGYWVVMFVTVDWDNPAPGSLSQPVEESPPNAD